MKKIVFQAIIICIMFTSLKSYSQESNLNIIGASIGIIPTWKDGIYVDTKIGNFWYNRKTTPVINLFYLRKVYPYLALGGYFEFESTNFENQIDVSRINVGAKWIGRLPESQLHMQLGGYFGSGFIFPKDLKSLMGIDYGFIAGPAFEQDKIGVSLQIHAGYGYYWGNEEVETILLFIPKIFLKVYYTF